jgi:hypothetical protein
MERGVHLKESVFLNVINEYWKMFVIASMGNINSGDMFLFAETLNNDWFRDTEYRFQYDMKNDCWILKPKSDEED